MQKSKVRKSFMQTDGFNSRGMKIFEQSSAEEELKKLSTRIIKESSSMSPPVSPNKRMTIMNSALRYE